MYNIHCYLVRDVSMILPWYEFANRWLLVVSFFLPKICRGENKLKILRRTMDRSRHFTENGFKLS